MITVRRSDDRGLNDWGWLQSLNTFSVGSYYDPEHMGYSALRVLNDDTVVPSKGFPPHPHKDMEIISMVLSGVIEHKDSEGNKKTLGTCEYQLMSAGNGITHSEYNPLDSIPLRFMQIWIEPNEAGGTPSYQQNSFSKTNGLTPIVTSTGENGTLKIKQDMAMYQLILDGTGAADLPTSKERLGYIHVISGSLNVNGITLNEGDGAKIADEESLTTSNSDNTNKVTALFFDLPK
ncbi:pirin family protein [Vibrio gigantis]|uniref:pirin family protein n=1 Tax=Vibrio gigantis TaxID=296199 RepID=UPI003D0D1502